MRSDKSPLLTIDMVKAKVLAAVAVSVVGISITVGVGTLVVNLTVDTDTSTGNFAQNEISVVDSDDTTISIGDRVDVSVTNEIYQAEPNWVGAGSVTTNGESAEINLDGLEPCKEYTVQASLDADFREGAFTTFSTPCETTD